MNGDRANPVVELEIGGKVRKLLFTVNAACLIEKELGREVLTGLFQTGNGYREIRAVMWAMLKHAEPSLTLEQVGGWLELPRFSDYIKALLEAYSKAFPATEAEEKNA
jgi:hypothetical protein